MAGAAVQRQEDATTESKIAAIMAQNAGSASKMQQIEMTLNNTRTTNNILMHHILDPLPLPKSANAKKRPTFDSGAAADWLTTADLLQR